MKAYIIALLALLFVIKVSATPTNDMLNSKFYCDGDHKFKSKFIVIRFQPDPKEKKYDYYIKDPCADKISTYNTARGDGSQNYYCYEYSYVKKGESCKIDSDCVKGLLCKNEKCSDQCDNSCENNQACKLESGSTDKYKCYDYGLKDAKCDTYPYLCAPGLFCLDDKCIEKFTEADGKEVKNDDQCESGYSYGGKCHTIEKAECDKKNGVVTFEDKSTGTISCFYHEYYEKYEPEYSPERQKFFKDKLVKRYKDKLNPEKHVKKEKTTLVLSYLDDEKLKEYYFIYNNWAKLRLNEIIDEEGKIQGGKKKCYLHVRSWLSSSTLKTSLALALFALLL